MWTGGEGSDSIKKHWRGCLAQALRHKTFPMQESYTDVWPVLKLVKLREHLGYWQHWQVKEVTFLITLMVFSPVVTCLVVSKITAVSHYVSWLLLLHFPSSSISWIPPLLCSPHATWLMPPFPGTWQDPVFCVNSPAHKILWVSSIHKFNTCCLCKLTFLLSDLNQLVEESSGSSRQPACPEAMRRRPRLQPLVEVICLWNCACQKQRLPSSSSDTLPRLPSCQKSPKP